MLKIIKTGPIVCAACGTALSYFFLFPWYRSGSISTGCLIALVLLPVAALSLCVTLVFRPLAGEASPQTVRVLRLLPSRIAAFAAGLALGIGTGTTAARPVTFGIPADTVQGISGIALDDPYSVSKGDAGSAGRTMTRLSLQTAEGSGGVKAAAQGIITVFFPEEHTGRLREFGRGTAVFASGELRGGTGSFAGAYTFTASSLHITAAAPPIESLRTTIRLNLARRFTEPPFGEPAWGGLALALLLGIRDNLDSRVASLYRDAGCSHILALSGMHLAVLVALISVLLKRALGLRLAAIFGAIIILVYCYIVGPLPSLNRAALMYVLGVCAVLGMLKRDLLLLLCMAFMIQLAITPQAGLSLSFILSYLALAGILTIGGLFASIFDGMIPHMFLSPVSASAGAFIATAGVTAAFFGVLRPVGIIAGLVLTPLTTVFMLGSMAWLVLSLVFPALSPLLGHPLSLLYWLMERVATVSAYIPGIKASPLVVMPLSLILVAVLAVLDCRRRFAENRLKPFA